MAGLLVRGVVKAVALAVGLVGTVIGLDALVGAVTENGWARLVVILLVTFGVTLFLADRFLPDSDDGAKARGLVTDVVALVWLGFTVGFIGLGHAVTKPLLLREGDRLVRDGWSSAAELTYWAAGARSDAPAPTKTRPARSGPSKNAADAGAETRADAAAADADAGVATAPDAGTAPRTPATPGTEKTPAEIFREWAPSVVTVSVEGERGEGGGTGFIIDRQGTIGTNHHVIAGARKVEIKLFDGTVLREVELLDDSTPNDLALLRVKTRAKLRPVALGDSERITVGDRIVSIGNPLGLEHTLTDGLVSARRILEGRKMIQMSVPVSPGNSGGPLFNMQGEVIGVTTAQYAGGDFFGRAQNLNLAMPINLLRAMIRPAYPGRRQFGDSRGTPNTW